jgi:hypothetical protein
MKRSGIDIDFIRRRRLPVVPLALLFAALVILADRVADWRALETAQAQLLARIASLEGQLERRERVRAQQRQQPDPAARHQQAQNDKVLAALAYPWAQVLAIVEQPDMHGVALLSFGHDAEARQVRLTVEGADLPAIARYVEQLNQAGAGRMAWQWYVAAYQLQTQNAPTTVRATVLTR